MRAIRAAHTISTVRQRLAKVFLLIGILVTARPAFPDPSSRIEKLAGRIVAYSGGLTCLNGNAYWSVLIHVQEQAADAPSRFVEVEFSLPCDKSPEWITHKSSLQQFRLTRSQAPDSVLKEFMECRAESPRSSAPEPCPHFPIWKRIPGAEDEKLPFGQRVSSYRSVDLPLVPVL